MSWHNHTPISPGVASWLGPAFEFCPKCQKVPEDLLGKDPAPEPMRYEVSGRGFTLSGKIDDPGKFPLLNRLLDKVANELAKDK